MKTKALISCAVTAQLICSFVFAYAKIRFSHDEAHFITGDTLLQALDMTLIQSMEKAASQSTQYTLVTEAVSAANILVKLSLVDIHSGQYEIAWSSLIFEVTGKKILIYFHIKSSPRPSGLGEIDGLHGTSTQSCILTYDLCTGEPLRRPKPAQDEWYVIMSGHPFIKALAAYWGGAFVQGLRCHFISMPGKIPMKLEVTSRHDHSCLLGHKALKQTNKTMP